MYDLYKITHSMMNKSSRQHNQLTQAVYSHVHQSNNQWYSNERALSRNEINTIIQKYRSK